MAVEPARLGAIKSNSAEFLKRVWVGLLFAWLHFFVDMQLLFTKQTCCPLHEPFVLSPLKRQTCVVSAQEAETGAARRAMCRFDHPSVETDLCRDFQLVVVGLT